jgi:RNA polymerase sigma-70 factor (ECF subfamily)
MLEETVHIQEFDDSLLIRKAKKGETEAFGDLYERYAEAVFRFVYSQTVNRFDAEDITADVFLRAWNSLPRYEERGYSFSAYLFRIARNVMIDRSRKQKPVSEIPDDELLNEPGQLLSEPSAMMAAKIQHHEIVKFLSQLREDYRTVLILRFFNDLSTEETSAAMGRSKGAVRVLQHRALSALRQLLPEQGFEL